MNIKSIFVNQNGMQDAVTLNEAFSMAQAVPADTTVEIHIAAGTYKEKLALERNNVTLIGENAENTIITFDDYALFMMPDNLKRGTFRSYTIFVHSNHFTAKNLTFANTAGYGPKIGQAVAVYADGDCMMFENCRFLGRQDTLFTAPLPPTVVEWGGFRGPREHAPRDNGTHYYKNCYIEGDVDFIYGGATAYFEECEIFSMARGGNPEGYITAASTPEGRPYGYVFNKCRFTSDCAPETVYLGRPWRSFAKTVIMNSELGNHIKKEGWHDWGKEEAHTQTFYAEYNNFGPGASPDTRADWSHQLTAEEAALYTKENILWNNKDSQK